MGKHKELGVDKNGVQKVLRGYDYLADMLGQFGLALIGNLVGQLTYFYTDKVGLAVGGVGIAMGIAKVIDAVTDIWFGNVVEQSKGGNEKYYKWMKRMMIPAAITIIMLFTVPKDISQVASFAYVTIINILLTAVFYTLISTPFAATIVVRTKSLDERSNLGIFRAIGSYIAGIIMAIAIIPITNALGGTQNAWIKFGFIIALVVLLSLLICSINGNKAVMQVAEYETEEKEEEKVSFKEAAKMLFASKYWVIVLLFNIITSVTNAISASANTYYCKWIFGNDNLVALVGGFGLLGTVIGFGISKPIIEKLGVKGAIDFGLLGTIGAMIIRCFAPANMVVYVITGIISSVMMMPLMCLYGVLLGMAVDYNEYKYDKKLVAISSGAIGFGSKVGSGIGSVILSAFLVIGAYDASLQVATTSMRYSIYGFANFFPIFINLLMYIIFRGFDLEEKLPQMKEEVEKRRMHSEE